MQQERRIIKKSPQYWVEQLQRLLEDHRQNERTINFPVSHVSVSADSNGEQKKKKTVRWSEEVNQNEVKKTMKRLIHECYGTTLIEENKVNRPNISPVLPPPPHLMNFQSTSQLISSTTPLTPLPSLTSIKIPFNFNQIKKYNPEQNQNEMLEIPNNSLLLPLPPPLLVRTSSNQEINI